MRRLLVLVLVLVNVMQVSAVHAQDDAHTLTVANWIFDVRAAVKAPFFMDTIHLGTLDDGRDWLVVTMIATNTSGEKQELHSDEIQLRSGGEMFKQTGDESDAVADELGYRSIGGSFPHDIEAGSVFEIVQVFKVSPDAASNSLIFDFSGEWEIPLDDLIASSNGDSRQLVIGGTNEQEEATEQSPWSIETASYQLDLIGASSAPTFSGPFHLGNPGEDQRWLIVTYELMNLRDEETEVKADSHKLLTGGEELKQATEETKTVSSELGISMLTLELQPDETVDVVQVFKAPLAATDFTFQVSARGKLFINLTPAVLLANGGGDAIVPGNSIDLAQADTEGESLNLAPTPVPTATTAPTNTPAPTDVPQATEEQAPTETPGENDAQATSAPSAVSSGEPPSTQTDPSAQLVGRLGGTLSDVRTRFGEPSWTDAGLLGFNSVSLGGTDAILVVYYEPDETVREFSIVYLERPMELDQASAISRVVAEVAPLDGECQDGGTSPDSNAGVISCDSPALATAFDVAYMEEHDQDGDAGSYHYAVDPTADEYFEITVQPGAPTAEAATEMPPAEAQPTSAPDETSTEGSMDESTYGTTVFLQTQQMADSLDRFSLLAQFPEFTSDDWIIDVAVELATWHRIYREASEIVPPPRFEAAHAKYVEGLSYLSQAADEIAYGIDFLDASAFDRATELINLGNAAILEATEEVRAVTG